MHQYYQAKCKASVLPAVPKMLTLLPRDETEDFSVKENVDKEAEKCSSNSAIGGLALPSGDTAMNTIDFIECRKIIYPYKMAFDSHRAPVVETMPSETCPHNHVLIAFQAFSDGSPVKRWNNPTVLQGICNLLINFRVVYQSCENVAVSHGPWIGQVTKDSSTWDMIFYCPIGSLAIGMTRELQGSDYKIVNLMCCPITYI